MLELDSLDLYTKTFLIISGMLLITTLTSRINKIYETTLEAVITFLGSFIFLICLMVFNYANYDKNVLLKSMLPNFIYQKLDITKDKNFLVIDTFNTSTVNGEFISSFGKGWGLIYYLFICIYVLIFSLLAKVFCNRITEIFIGVFLIFTIFSSVILKEIFVITLLFSFFQGFLSSFQFKLYK